MEKRLQSLIELAQTALKLAHEHPELGVLYLGEVLHLQEQADELVFAMDSSLKGQI